MELLIVAAGKGSRMGEIVIPKTLVSISGVPNLENTVTTIGKYFSKITIAVAHSMVHHFAKFIQERNYKNVFILPIASGLGSGHAVMMALKSTVPNLRAKTSSPMLVTWGDVYFQNDQLIQELVNEERIYERVKNKPIMIIPCAWDEKPYISISVDGDLCAEGITFNDDRRGLHDQSLFLVTNPAELYRHLFQMHCAIWNNGSYITEIKEFGFLQVVSYLYNIDKAARVYITENGLLGFNTQQEVTHIENMQSVAKQLEEAAQRRNQRGEMPLPPVSHQPKEYGEVN